MWTSLIGKHLVCKLHVTNKGFHLFLFELDTAAAHVLHTHLIYDTGLGKSNLGPLPLLFASPAAGLVSDMRFR